jgi:hypothetical protein
MNKSNSILVLQTEFLSFVLYSKTCTREEEGPCDEPRGPDGKSQGTLG